MYRITKDSETQTVVMKWRNGVVNLSMVCRLTGSDGYEAEVSSKLRKHYRNSRRWSSRSLTRSHARSRCSSGFKDGIRVGLLRPKNGALECERLVAWALRYLRSLATCVLAVYLTVADLKLIDVSETMWYSRLTWNASSIWLMYFD